LRYFQPERALLTREILEERRRELDVVLSQLAQRRADRLPAPPPLSIEAQFQRTIINLREDVQRAKDVQTTHILRWLRS
jgi:hypothetical protein